MAHAQPLSLPCPAAGRQHVTLRDYGARQAFCGGSALTRAQHACLRGLAAILQADAHLFHVAVTENLKVVLVGEVEQANEAVCERDVGKLGRLHLLL